MIELIDPFGLSTRDDIRVIRQSMLGTADVCLKRIEYDLRAGQTNTTHTVKGTAYHAGAEHWYRCYPDTDLNECLEQARFVFDAEVAFFGDDIDWSVQAQDECWADVADGLQTYILGGNTWPIGDNALDPSKFYVVGCEIDFWMPLFPEAVWTDDKTGALDLSYSWRSHWAAKGTIDLILTDGCGNFYIVDHKTAGKPWKPSKSSSRHNNQPAWYLHWWPELYEHTEHAGRGPLLSTQFFFDVICFDGTFKRIPAPRSRNEIDTTLYKARQLAELLETGAPLMPNTASSLCSPKWCRHWNDCPWGESFRL